MNYKLLYNELSKYLPETSEELENEIMQQFINTGIVYHSPNRLVASKKHEGYHNGLVFQRGIPVDDIKYISGLGFYSINEFNDNYDNLLRMFNFEPYNLKSVWQKITSQASWIDNMSFELNTEYIRMNPPFSTGYWIKTPDKSGDVSILRSGDVGHYLYYLYRYINNHIEVSQIPNWMVDSYNYRSISCACLSSHNTLPTIKYYEDGVLVHVHMNYLLPPQELEFLKLYSWPETFTLFPCNFKRKLTKEVFYIIKSILSNKGYEFQGG